MKLKEAEDPTVILSATESKKVISRKILLQFHAFGTDCLSYIRT